MKTDDLNGLALEWAVVKAHGWEPRICHQGEEAIIFYRTPHHDHWYAMEGFSTNGHWCMTLIEQEGIWLRGPHDACKPDGTVVVKVDEWYAHRNHHNVQCGPTPMVAAYRCYIASKLGDEIDIPKELL